LGGNEMEEVRRWTERLAELYGLCVVYKEEKKSFAHFARNNSHLSIEELEDRLEDIRGYQSKTPHEAIAQQLELASKRHGVQLVKRHGVQLVNVDYKDLQELDVDSLVSIISTVATGDVRTINIDKYLAQPR